jgi:spermidine synthase
VFGKCIKQAQIDTISYIPHGAAVLIIGGGTGWYLQELLTRKKLQKVVYIEASRKMLNLTHKSIQKILPELSGTTVELRLGTEDKIYPHEHFDVVVTHFFLDMFSQHLLQKISQVLHRSLKQNGLWLIADFRISATETGLHQWWKKELVKSMYLFFRAVCHISAKTLPDFGCLFADLGLQLAYESTFYKGLIFSAVYGNKK